MKAAHKYSDNKNGKTSDHRLTMFSNVDQTIKPMEQACDDDEEVESVEDDNLCPALLLDDDVGEGEV